MTQIPDLSTLKKDDEEPILEITLPASPNMDENTPLSYGAHNASHKINYERIGYAFKVIINAQNNLAKAIDGLKTMVEKLTERVDNMDKGNKNE